MIAQESNTAVATEDEVTEFFADSRTRLVNFAQSFVRDRGHCEDIVAEAYIQVVNRVRKGKGPSFTKLESYVRVCIRNEAFRQGKRHSHEIPTPFIETLVDEMLETVGAPQHEGTWDENAAARAFHSLSPRSQAVLQLATIQGCRFTEISTQLGISERAVVSAAFRARESLRTRYLVEITTASHTCRDTKIEYLASYARDQSSPRREEKISAHLRHCSSCEQTVHRMRALRLPALVIVGIAATAGGGLSLGAGSAQAVELPSENPLPSPLRHPKPSTTRNIVGGASIAALLIAAALFLLFMRPDQAELSTPEGATSQQQTTPSRSSEQSSTDQPDGSNHQDSDDPAQTSDKGASRNNDDNGDALPDGVHSVEWSDIPDNYVAGGSAARLLLSVGFDRSGNPGDYNVIVTLPANASLNRASAGCAADGSVILCRPSENLVPTDLFRWQFYVDLGDDFSGDLPTAQLVERTA